MTNIKGLTLPSLFSQMAEDFRPFIKEYDIEFTLAPSKRESKSPLFCYEEKLIKALNLIIKSALDSMIKQNGKRAIMIEEEIVVDEEGKRFLEIEIKDSGDLNIFMISGLFTNKGEEDGPGKLIKELGGVLLSFSNDDDPQNTGPFYQTTTIIKLPLT